MEETAASCRRMASEAGLLLLLAGELDRREGWRSEGATSLEAWLVERCGMSQASARTFAHVAERLTDLPHLAARLLAGELTFDKVRAVADVATPESDHDVAAQAHECTVRELHEIARSERGVSRSRAQTDYAARSVRFNDACRTVTAQLPPEAYAEVRSCLEAARTPSRRTAKPNGINASVTASSDSSGATRVRAARPTRTRWWRTSRSPP